MTAPIVSPKEAWNKAKEYYKAEQRSYEHMWLWKVYVHDFYDAYMTLLSRQLQKSDFVFDEEEPEEFGEKVWKIVIHKDKDIPNYDEFKEAHTSWQQRKDCFVSLFAGEWEYMETSTDGCLRFHKGDDVFWIYPDYRVCDLEEEYYEFNLSHPLFQNELKDYEAIVNSQKMKVTVEQLIGEKATYDDHGQMIFGNKGEVQQLIQHRDRDWETIAS